MAESNAYERRDLRVSAVVWFAVGLIATLALTFITMRFFESATIRGAHPAAAHEDFPVPRLQREPTVDLAAFRATEDQQLHAYRWIDRPAGLIQIPIERAMDLTAQRGLPTRKAQKESAP